MGSKRAPRDTTDDLRIRLDRLESELSEIRYQAALSESDLERIVERVLQRIQKPSIFNQKTTPLPKHTHCALTRYLVERKHPGAAIVGRQYLLSSEVIAQHLSGLHKPWLPREQTAGEKLEAELDELARQGKK